MTSSASSTSENRAGTGAGTRAGAGAGTRSGAGAGIRSGAGAGALMLIYDQPKLIFGNKNPRVKIYVRRMK